MRSWFSLAAAWGSDVAIVKCVKRVRRHNHTSRTGRGIYYAVRRIIFYSGIQSWSSRRMNLVTPSSAAVPVPLSSLHLLSRVPCTDRTPKSESRSVILLQPHSIDSDSRRRGMRQDGSSPLPSRALFSPRGRLQLLEVKGPSGPDAEVLKFDHVRRPVPTLRRCNVTVVLCYITSFNKFSLGTLRAGPSIPIRNSARSDARPASNDE